MALNSPVDDETGDEVTVDISPKKKREFSGTDADPVDVESGESVFDDLRNSPFRTFTDEKADDKEEDAEESGEEEPEDEKELEIEDEDATEDSDTETDDDGAGPTDDTDEEDPRQAKFDKRLSRAERIANEAVAESRALRARLAETEKKQAIEAGELKYNSDKAVAQSKVASIKGQLAEAVEAGDSPKQAELMGDLADASADLKIVERVYTEAKLALAQRKDEARESPIAATKVEKWKRMHRRFGTDKKFTSIAKAYEQEAFNEGLTPDTQEFFDHIDKNMARHYPKEFGKKVPVKIKQRQAPSVQLSRETDTRQTRQTKDPTRVVVKNGKARLTVRHQEIMREFGLDPENKDDVAEFARNNK